MFAYNFGILLKSREVNKPNNQILFRADVEAMAARLCAPLDREPRQPRLAAQIVRSAGFLDASVDVDNLARYISR